MPIGIGACCIGNDHWDATAMEGAPTDVKSPAEEDVDGPAKPGEMPNGLEGPAAVGLRMLREARLELISVDVRSLGSCAGCVGVGLAGTSEGCERTRCCISCSRANLCFSSMVSDCCFGFCVGDFVALALGDCAEKFEMPRSS